MARTPFSDLPKGHDERRGIRPVAAGLILVAVVALASFFAFTKANPFASPYELNAVFKHAHEIKTRSPVRIAGVQVGRVVAVEPVPESRMALIKMEIDEDALPIKRDATARLRPRLFLEGNYFIDLHPGTPAGEELASGGTIPPNQTATPVQFGQFLTSLQKDTREDLQTLLQEYSKALEGPGARGINQAVSHWEEAYRNTAMSSRAYLGREDGDLHRLLRGQGRVFGALARNTEALKTLVTSLRQVAGGFARESGNLQETIVRLRRVIVVGEPALRSLNGALPSLRAFAREALPAARSSAPTLDAQIPFVREARGLVSRDELRGLAAELRRTVPFLATLNRRSSVGFRQTRALASCQNNVLLPFAQEPVPDPDFPEASGEPWYKTGPRLLVGLAGESRVSDANSPMARVLAGGGPLTIVGTGEAGDEYIAQLDLPIQGVRPVSPTRRPVFRPGVPCETQEAPDLNALGGPGDPIVTPNPVATPENLAREQLAQDHFDRFVTHMSRIAAGEPSVDPLDFSDAGELLQMEQLGFAGKRIEAAKREMSAAREGER
jgi:phospholipid/cholesterol/gamma-HCH transport system substrate-binding protein